MVFSVRISEQLKEWVKNDKPTSFRFEEWLKEEIVSFMKRKNITKKSKGLHGYVRFLKNDTENYKQALASENLKKSTANEPSIDCPYLVGTTQCLRFIRKKGQIKKTNHDICKKCMELEEIERQLEKIKEAKSIKTERPITTPFYKKSAKTYDFVIPSEGLKKCPMYDGDYVGKDICGKCKNKTPSNYEMCQKGTLERYLFSIRSGN